MKHTQGEWVYSELWVWRKHGTQIAYIGYNTDGHDKNVLTDESIANGKLIAAAPELLEACCDAIAQICNHEDGHKKQFQDVYNKLESAIQKAIT